jgi:hypothetical protein
MREGTHRHGRIDQLVEYGAPDPAGRSGDEHRRHSRPRHEDLGGVRGRRTKEILPPPRGQKGSLAPVLNESAPPGKELKYARRERERRFLLGSLPDGPTTRTVRIADRYLTGTRLRLRRATDTSADGGGSDRTVYKLTQKVPRPQREPGLITTMYLSPAEYSVLSELPAAALHKTRLSIPPLGVDVFEGRLAGLLLAEAEFDDDVSMRAFRAPPGAIAEVTYDERLSGGRLVVTTWPDLAAVLREYDALADPT